MNKPIQFITISNEGKCKLTKEAEEIISKINSNLGIVCIAGIYRSGKSYLLNRLLGRQDGFEIGPTIASCTKGLWLWGEPVKLPEKNLEVLIVDTEGLASAFEDRNESIDMIIFCLGLLLSSLFIYNSMKNIDESAIENLALVLNFAKKIQNKFKDLNNYVNNFPSFLWVLRDFALELVDQSGNSITARQYLENSLREENMANISMSSFNKGMIDEISKKNEIRQTLKLFFKERDCYTLVRPVNEEKKLKLIDKLPTSELRKEFLNQMNTLVKKVFDSVRPKQIQGSYMNGKMYLNLIKMFISALNSDNLPDIKTSWKIVVEQQMQAGFNKSFNYYHDEMSKFDYTKLRNVEDLLIKHNQCKETATNYLQEFADLNIPLSVCLDIYKKLEKKINDDFINFYHQWRDHCVEQCSKLAKQLIEKYKKKPEMNEIFSCLDTIEEVLKFIDETPINEKKHEVMYPLILQYFIQFLKQGVREVKTKNEMEQNNLKNEITMLKNVNEKTKEILETTKDMYEKQIKEIKEENLENRINLEAKIDDKNKIIQNMQNSNQNTVNDLQMKIMELSKIIELNSENEKKGKKGKKGSSSMEYDDTVLDYKLNNIIDRLDNIKSVMFKTELERVKNQMLTEMDEKYDTVIEEFRNKLKTCKKNCEKALIKLKLSKDDEINKLKQIIKELNDEVQDYKSQVDAQEYRISLFKEKIINYEREKKAQTDHAELLKVLALKLNKYVDELSHD